MKYQEYSTWKISSINLDINNQAYLGFIKDLDKHNVIELDYAENHILFLTVFHPDLIKYNHWDIKYYLNEQLLYLAKKNNIKFNSIKINYYTSLIIPYN